MTKKGCRSKLTEKRYKVILTLGYSNNESTALISKQEDGAE